MARGTRSQARVACEGPRPTVKGGFSLSVARGPVPRDHWIARVAWRGTGFPTALRERMPFFFERIVLGPLGPTCL